MLKYGKYDSNQNGNCLLNLQLFFYINSLQIEFRILRSKTEGYPKGVCLLATDELHSVSVTSNLWTSAF